MLTLLCSTTRHCACLLLAVLSFIQVALAVDKDAENQDGRAAGILIDKGDKWLTVKADGEEQPVKYLFGDDSNKRLTESLKGIFNASRVQLTYKKEGDARRLVTIKKQAMKTSGTVTGVVVKVYNAFWVEVKPKTGVSDAYALSPANWDNKDFVAKMKDLKPGDTVTIKFYTDFERHRIETLRKHEATTPPTSTSKPGPDLKGNK